MSDVAHTATEAGDDAPQPTILETWRDDAGKQGRMMRLVIRVLTGGLLGREPQPEEAADAAPAPDYEEQARRHEEACRAVERGADEISDAREYTMTLLAKTP